MRLFRYISGDNADSEKVAMTVPVFMEPGGATAGEMGFVIPKQISEDRVPQPADQEVQIRKRSPGTFATIRFAGRPDRDAFRQAEQELRAWMAEQDLVGNNEVEAASYDPPWTPRPFRRNEILIRISPNEDGPT
jgi:hypothetical protein